MRRTSSTARFERRSEVAATSPTLIVGMPENGVVGSIAVTQLTKQLDLEHEGNIVSDLFPPVATFGEGQVRDLVRVYAGADPDVVIPHCDIALPMRANAELASCILDDLAAEYERAIALIGAPAHTEEQVGEVTCIVTSEEAAEQVSEAGIPLEPNVGFVGGASGAIINECYHANVPTIGLVVKAHPYLPDPQAARAVIEEALEPLVDFDIDTSELQYQADDIRRRMEQIAQHYEQLQERQARRPSDESSMYQ